MNFALGYLLYRFLFRLTDFFHHWYVDGSKIFFGRLINVLEAADRFFAVGVNLRHFFQPLFSDYSIIGRFLGVIFRAIRIVLGLLVYGFIISIFLVAYSAWASVPVLVMYQIFNGIAR